MLFGEMALPPTNKRCFVQLACTKKEPVEGVTAAAIPHYSPTREECWLPEVGEKRKRKAIAEKESMSERGRRR